jgi:putative transcriptional regulator
LKNRLRELRSIDSVSQAKMGDVLGVSRQTINSIENGKYDPSLSLAFKISKYYRLKIEDIFNPD